MSKAKATKDTKDPKDPKAPKEHDYLAEVYISLKETVNDPVGITIGGALSSLGFESVQGVRSGRYFQVRLRAASEKRAGKQIDKMCARLLANPVIETYRYAVKNG